MMPIPYLGEISVTLDISLLATFIIVLFTAVISYFGNIIADARVIKESKWGIYVDGLAYTIIFIAFPIAFVYSIGFELLDIGSIILDIAQEYSLLSSLILVALQSLIAIFLLTPKLLRWINFRKPYEKILIDSKWERWLLNLFFIILTLIIVVSDALLMLKVLSVLLLFFEISVMAIFYGAQTLPRVRVLLYGDDEEEGILYHFYGGFLSLLRDDLSNVSIAEDSVMKIEYIQPIEEKPKKKRKRRSRKK